MAVAAQKTQKTKKPQKKVAAKASKSSQPSYKSFRVSKNDAKFMSSKPSMQTVYWLILSVILIVFTSWIVYLSVKINAIYDKIDQSEIIYSSIDDTPVKVKKTTVSN